MYNKVKSQIISICNLQGLQRVGFAAMNPSLRYQNYVDWIQKGFHGSMSYLEKSRAIKEDPELFLKDAKTALVVLYPYVPHPFPQEYYLKSVALYAQGLDYHIWFKQKLISLAEDLKKEFSSETFVPLTDSSPFLERDLAYQAGLGWFGKNTTLINSENGSYFFIGEVIMTLEVSPDLPQKESYCDSCERCMKACPTQALIKPYAMDARKCLSYLTIEAKNFTIENAQYKNRKIFGCDICQKVCPWNKKEKFYLREEVIGSKNLILLEELKYILNTSNNRLNNFIQKTPLSRAGASKLKRNALWIIGQNKITSLRSDVELYLDHPKWGWLARWTLSQLDIVLSE